MALTTENPTMWRGHMTIRDPFVLEGFGGFEGMSQHNTNELKGQTVVSTMEAPEPQTSEHLKQVQVTAKFIQWQPLYEHEKLFQILIEPLKDSADPRTTNLVYEDRTITIRDIRGHELEFTLNNHGFKYVNHDFAFTDYESVSAVEAEYLPKVEQFLRSKLEDVNKVFFFDWKVSLRPLPSSF